MTVPRVTRDLLMFAPSFNLLPVAPVEFALSLVDSEKKTIIIETNTAKFQFFTSSATTKSETPELGSFFLPPFWFESNCVSFEK